MTATVPTLVEHQTDLFREISRLLDQHPAGSAFRLMHTPHDLDLTPDEVLVQSVDPERRVVELRPRKLSELVRSDVLHATQVLDPGDHGLNAYALRASASNCMVKDGTHWYVMANQKAESC